MKNLPIGISTLSKILENNMIYIDKTAYVYRLATTAGAYFLSRPRRFGKSLFLDTFKSLFEGREELFRGLYIHDKWDWTRKHPVIKVDFGIGGIHTRAQLEMYLRDFLQNQYNKLSIPLPKEQDLTPSLFLRRLITLAAEQFKTSIVILIDEYDKPLLDNIEKSRELQDEIREGLRDFYSVIKEQDANLQFVFLTGVSKFSKVSIFSGINNLKDLSLDPAMAACCGYTEEDLDLDFSDHLKGVDRELLRTWYNGYNFLGPRVYNPFDILLFISNGHSYRSYWFETGTPTFLMKLFQQRRYFLPELEQIVVGEELLSSFEIDNIEPVTLLYQTGYLTIKETSTSRGRLVYTLGFPNFEVKVAFNEYLIHAYTELTVEKLRYQDGVYNSLLGGDLPGLEAAITRLFAGIAHRNYTNNPISQFEGYYASVLYAFFSSINCTVIPEDIDNQGQADLTVILDTNIYVMEIKVVDNQKLPEKSQEKVQDKPQDNSQGKSEDKPQEKAEVSGAPNAALEQIIARNYAAKYRGQPGKQVFELGLVFGRQEKNLVQFGWR